MRAFTAHYGKNQPACLMPFVTIGFKAWLSAPTILSPICANRYQPILNQYSVNPAYRSENDDRQEPGIDR